MTDDLFTTEPNLDPAHGRQTLPTSGHSVYIPLNRLNLIPIVSTGLIRPARAYNKYYEDVLGIRDDLIPLFQVSPGRELTEYCAIEGVNAFPVILELSEDAFTADELSAGATARPVPANRLRAVHCRNDIEARELLAHTWENASLSSLPVDVMPALFEEEGEQPEDLRGKLMPLPQGDPDLFERLSAASRITGGLMAVAGLGEEQRGWAEALLRAEQPATATPSLNMIRHALLNRTPASGEERLLSSMVHALVTLGFPSRESAEQLLDIYKAQAARDFPEDGRIQKTVERAQHVLIRHDIRPGDDSSAPVSFGLLLHALRNRLDELTPDRPDWATFFEAGLPSLDTLAVARFLTGMRTGRHRLDTTERIPELDRLAAIWEADAAVSPFEPLLLCRRQQKTEETRTITVNNAQNGLEVDKTVTMQLDMSEDNPLHNTLARETEAQALLQPNNLELNQIPQISEQNEDFKMAVCNFRGWIDLLAIQVQLGGTNNIELIPERGSKISLLLPYDVSIKNILRSDEEYRLRLEEYPLSPEDLELIQSIHEPQTKKSRRKKSNKK